MLTARNVLQDCRHSLQLLNDETDEATFRVLWTAGVSLARAVGHTLRNVDAQTSPTLREAVDKLYQNWKSDRATHQIFWDFIAHERNMVLKQYEAGFYAGPVEITSGEDGPYRLTGQLFCPINDGPYAGEDCRDVLAEAIEWWERQLAFVESSSSSAPR